MKFCLLALSATFILGLFSSTPAFADGVKISHNEAEFLFQDLDQGRSMGGGGFGDGQEIRLEQFACTDRGVCHLSSGVGLSLKVATDVFASLGAGLGTITCVRTAVAPPHSHHDRAYSYVFECTARY